MTEKTNTWYQDTPFPPHDHKDWRNSVDALLKGADYNKTLVSRTVDGIEIEPLYQQHQDAPYYGRASHANNTGDDKNHNTPWSIQQTYNTGSLTDANEKILADLMDGTSSIELAISASTTTTSLECASVAELETLLSGVHLDMINVSLTPGPQNPLTGALLLAYCYRQKIAAEKIHCGLNIDPLGTQATTGLSATKSLNELPQYANYCDKQFPNISSVCVDSSVYHNAGCSEAQELAYLVATAVEYLRALQTLDTDTAFKQMRFRVAIDNDYFLNISKLRAARELIAQVKKACGADNTPIVIDAFSSKRSLTSIDESVNILRTSTQAAAAMTGGADGFNCTAFNALSNTTEKAHRLARNTQHILIEESRLLDVNDPTRGSGYIEALTQSLCESAWTILQNIEASGGMQKAITTGLIEEQVLSAKALRTDAINIGKASMIGVTDFPNADEILSVSCSDQPATNNLPDAATPTADAASVSVTALIGDLSEGASALDYLPACQAEKTSTPLESYRDAHTFEQLRRRSEQFKSAHGKPPAVTLVTIGSGDDYAARVGFCKNFFAVAGIKTSVVSATDIPTTNNDLLVICGSDDKYMDDGFDSCNNLNAKALWIAGNNPKVLDKLEPLNIGESIHLRSDKVSLLNKALQILESSQ